MNKNSTDVWFIAYLLSKDFKIENYNVISHGKVKCFFNIQDKEWQGLKLEFHNSEIIKFKSYIEQIKDLAY